MGRKTLGIIRLDDGSFAVSGREEEALSPDSVSDIVIEGNQITVICKEGINNIVGIAADVLADVGVGVLVGIGVGVGSNH